MKRSHGDDALEEVKHKYSREHRHRDSGHRDSGQRDNKHRDDTHKNHKSSSHRNHRSHSERFHHSNLTYRTHRSDRESRHYRNHENDHAKEYDSSDSEWVVAEESENIYSATQQRESIVDSDITDISGLNRLRAEILKAELKSSPQLQQLKEKYAEAERRLTWKDSDAKENIKVVDSKLLARVDESEDMTVQDMLKEEILSNERGERLDLKMAQQIAQDGGYANDLDYAEDNAEKLAKIRQKSENNLKNQVISKTRKLHEAIESCPFCFENERPQTTIISVATRVYLCLAAEPTLAKGTTIIVPIDHHINTLECDNDEWEEIRNFMKSLTQMWAKHNRGVLFYENAVLRSDRQHGGIVAVPVSFGLLDEAPGFFSQSILEFSDEWESHRKIIETAKKARESSSEAAKYAFRSSIAKQAPYFHVWFNINGGMGHIVEDINRWPKGDLFARQVIGGMLQLDPSIIQRQGEFRTNNQGRQYFETRWANYDWTAALD